MQYMCTVCVLLDVRISHPATHLHLGSSSHPLSVHPCGSWLGKNSQRPPPQCNPDPFKPCAAAWHPHPLPLFTTLPGHFPSPPPLRPLVFPQLALPCTLQLNDVGRANGRVLLSVNGIPQFSFPRLVIRTSEEQTVDAVSGCGAHAPLAGSCACVREGGTSMEELGQAWGGGVSGEFWWVVFMHQRVNEGVTHPPSCSGSVYRKPSSERKTADHQEP